MGKLKELIQEMIPQLIDEYNKNTQEYGFGMFTENRLNEFSNKISNEVFNEFPQLKPIIVFPPNIPKSTGDITTDILNAYLDNSHRFSNEQKHAENNIIEYVTEIEKWLKKWRGKEK